MLLCDTEEGETQFVSASVSSTSQIITVNLVSVSHQGFFQADVAQNVTKNNLLIYQIRLIEDHNFLCYLVAGHVGLYFRPNSQML